MKTKVEYIEYYKKLVEMKKKEYNSDCFKTNEELDCILDIECIYSSFIVVLRSLTDEE